MKEKTIQECFDEISEAIRDLNQRVSSLERAHNEQLAWIQGPLESQSNMTSGLRGLNASAGLQAWSDLLIGNYK